MKKLVLFLPLRSLSLLIWFVILPLLSVSCATTRGFQLVRFSDGVTIQGVADRPTRTFTVVMPDGEVLHGRSEILTNATFTMGFATGSLSSTSKAVATTATPTGKLAATTTAAGRTTATGTSTGFGIATGGNMDGYALLSGNNGTVMEIVYKVDPNTNHGFGEARTNKGEVYKMFF